MRNLYCGGAFDFDYQRPNYLQEAEEDYRAVLLGGADKFLQKQESVFIKPDLAYIGPFYFEADGMQDKDIISCEIEMIENCTDAVFLLKDAKCPGTIAELTLASSLKKRVYIFYVRARKGEETESELKTPCWYPILMSKRLNGENTRLFGFDDKIQARQAIKEFIERL
jgi:hypothetical protein